MSQKSLGPLEAPKSKKKCFFDKIFFFLHNRPLGLESVSSGAVETHLCVCWSPIDFQRKILFSQFLGKQVHKLTLGCVQQDRTRQSTIQLFILSRPLTLLCGWQVAKDHVLFSSWGVEWVVMGGIMLCARDETGFWWPTIEKVITPHGRRDKKIRERDSRTPPSTTTTTTTG